MSEATGKRLDAFYSDFPSLPDDDRVPDPQKEESIKEFEKIHSQDIRDKAFRFSPPKGQDDVPMISILNSFIPELKDGTVMTLSEAEKYLDLAGIRDRRDHRPCTLSGGERQRVAIARALAGNPDLIYFDEPTSALDPELTESVLQIIRTLAAEGMTMIVVTHELGFAESIATKAVLLEKGVVVEDSDANAFFNCPKEARTKAFLETFRR